MAPLYGVCVHTGFASERPIMLEAGVNAVRLDCQPSTRWNDAVNSNLNVLGIFSPHKTMSSYPDWGLPEWRSVVTERVNSYPQVRQWEIMNEITLKQFQGNNGYMYNLTPAVFPQHYVDCLREAYQIIKAANPANIVVGFSGLQTGYWGWDTTDSSQTMKDRDFLIACIGLGALNYCDVVSFHTYPGTSTTLPSGMYSAIDGHIKEIKALVGAKELWCSEWGIASSKFPDQATRLAWIQGVANVLNTNSVNKSFWYTWKDDSSAPTNPMGLITTGLVKKPEFYTWQTYISGILSQTPAYGLCVAGSGVTTSQIPQFQGIGVDWLRWGGVSTTFLNSGFKLMGTMGHNLMATPFTLAQWGSMVDSRTRAYPQIKCWEIWNEPTESTFRLGFTSPDTYRYGSSETASPQGYYNLLKDAYTRIKAYDPTLTVIGFGGMRVMSPGSSNPNQLHSDVSYFQNCVNLGALDYCDGVAIHAYPAYTGDYRVGLAAFPANFNAYNSIMAAKGKMREIWVTEWGVNTPSWIPSGLHQGDALRDIYAAIHPYSNKTFWYKHVDDSAGTEEPHHHGIYDINSNEKVVGASPLTYLSDYYKMYVTEGDAKLILTSTPIPVQWNIGPNGEYLIPRGNSIILQTPQRIDNS